VADSAEGPTAGAGGARASDEEEEGSSVSAWQAARRSRGRGRGRGRGRARRRNEEGRRRRAWWGPETAAAAAAGETEAMGVRDSGGEWRGDGWQGRRRWSCSGGGGLLVVWMRGGRRLGQVDRYFAVGSTSTSLV